MPHNKMLAELQSKALFEKAKDFAYDYMDSVDSMPVFPKKESLELLKKFDEPLQDETLEAEAVLEKLNTYGTPNTVAQTGGRYYGFVNGNFVPASLAAKWLSDVWDQNGGLYLTSPINAQLESTCEAWLKDIFKLPKETIAGYVSGTSTANFCALAAARFYLLEKLSWNVNEDGLMGAPKIRIIAHEQVHGALKKALGLLGFGKKQVEWLPADDQGRLVVESLPELDSTCLVLLQAGNANTGAFDDFETVCALANEAGAWVHIDGAFGLWAAACPSLSHLTKGIELADSWSVDGHKTLNTPYDSGIVLCKHPKALGDAMQATGEYIIYSEKRDSMAYIIEMSKRTRAIELWATMKYLGKKGIDEMVTGFQLRAVQLAKGLEAAGFEVLNDVVFNQVLVRYKSDEATKKIVAHLQDSGEIWLGGSTWLGQAAIRVSICSWKTSVEDIERTVGAFLAAKGSCD